VAWVRVDDSFYDHPKFIDLSLEATGLWLTMLAWSNRNLTDGIVPQKAVEKMGGLCITELVDAGLVERDLLNFRMVNYVCYQPSAEEVKARQADVSEKRRAAGRKGAAARWQTDSNPMATQSQPDDPNPNYIARARDEMFDAIVEVCGIDSSSLTKSAASMVGKARKSLVSVGATPESVRQAAAAYRRAYPTMALTPTALDKHYPSMVKSVVPVPVEAGTTLGRSKDAEPAWVLDENGVARPFLAP
jgi:hypothetical protein